MNIRPLGNRAIVKPIKSIESINGIILPDSSKKKQDCVEVVAVGPIKMNEDYEIISNEIEVGDIVMMEKYSGQTITYEEQEYMIVDLDKIIAVVDK